MRKGVDFDGTLGRAGPVMRELWALGRAEPIMRELRSEYAASARGIKRRAKGERC